MTRPALSDLVRVFGRIGLLSFGGPAAQIALMHRELVETRAWMSDAQFLRALSFCMVLPGPEAMQMATYAGWRLQGTRGGLIAGGLFVLPGAVAIFGLALLYAQYGTTPAAEPLLLGVKACALVLVGQALWRLGHKALTRRSDRLIAALSLALLVSVNLPFPLLVGMAALIGALRPAGTGPPPEPRQPLRHAPMGTIALWAGLWLLPLPVLWLTGQSLLFDLAAFFAKLAVVSFGGAYAVLAWMMQEVVQARGWLDAAQMVDALGLAETTPGPLILVTQFVGQLAGHFAGGWPLALAASLLTLWMTFVPCFLWIFAGAPYVEQLLARPRLDGALQAITAAVVGVIANLSLWFALHTLFADGLLTQPRPLALVPLTLAVLLLVVLKRGILLTIPACAGLTLLVSQGF